MTVTAPAPASGSDPEVCVLAYRLCGNVRGLAAAIRARGLRGTLICDEETAPVLAPLFDAVVPVAGILRAPAALDALRRRYGGAPPAALVCCSDRLGVQYARALSDLPHGAAAAEALMRVYRKSAMRERLGRTGVDRVPFRLLDADPERARAELTTLCRAGRWIMKPSCGTGSELVSHPLEGVAQALAWYEGLRRRRGAGPNAGPLAWRGTDWSRAVLIERYIPGPEYTIDGVVSDGRVLILGVIEKEFALEALADGFGEGANFAPAQLPEAARGALCGLVRRAVRALGLRRTAFHVEARWDAEERGFHIVEINPRLGGGTTTTIHEDQTGLSLPALWIDVALGGEVDDRDVAPAPFVCGDVPLSLTRPGVYLGYDDHLSEADRHGLRVVETIVPGTSVDPSDREAYFGFAYFREPTFERFAARIEPIRRGLRPRLGAPAPTAAPAPAHPADREA